MIQHFYHASIKSDLLTSKFLVLQGPKNSGKKTLIAKIASEIDLQPTLYDFSDKKLRKKIEGSNEDELVAFFKDDQAILIGEGQYLGNLQIILALALSGKLSQTLIITSSHQLIVEEVLWEALVLNNLVYTILPYSFYELAKNLSLVESEKLLEERLIFGSFPALVNSKEQASILLAELLENAINYTFSVNDRVNKSSNLRRLLEVLALHVGEPLSYLELGEKCGLDNETVERYINLLVKSYLIIRVPSFHTDQRYELKKMHVFYFMDLGLRNAIIQNFNGLSIRNDANNLWKNWLVAERIKSNNLNGKTSNIYFWRSHTRQMIDILEIENDKIFAYKTELSKGRKKIPSIFKKYYPESHFFTLNRSNYWSFLTKR